MKIAYTFYWIHFTFRFHFQKKSSLVVDFFIQKTKKAFRAITPYLKKSFKNIVF